MKHLCPRPTYGCVVEWITDPRPGWYIGYGAICIPAEFCPFCGVNLAALHPRVDRVL